MPATQTYANHARYYPLFHFVVVPLLAINFLSHLVRFIMAPSWALFFWVLLSITLILLALAARLMVLTVQNRVIRLEERLRYREVLGSEIAQRADVLPLGHIIALRFASDDELSDLVARALNSEFQKSKEIKIAVRNWRADHLRA